MLCRRYTIVLGDGQHTSFRTRVLPIPSLPPIVIISAQFWYLFCSKVLHIVFTVAHCQCCRLPPITVNKRNFSLGCHRMNPYNVVSDYSATFVRISRWFECCSKSHSLRKRTRFLKTRFKCLSKTSQSFLIKRNGEYICL